MSTPVRVRIRMYNVGFGDCFLLTFTYADGGERHALIDFGSTKLPTKGPASMKAVADKIREHTGGKLQMVAVTHRHADHLSGFSGAAGKVIRTLEPELVVQPWTEDPKLAPSATAPAGGAANGGGGNAGLAAIGAPAKRRNAVANLRAMDAAAKQIAALGKQMVDVANVSRTRFSKALAEEVHFLGETNIKNPGAVRNLMKLGTQRVYVHFGSQLPIETILPGVKIEVLGPPTLEQEPGIAQLASRNATEYWHLAATTAPSVGSADAAALFPHAKIRDKIPQSARWLTPQIDRMSAEELLSIVRSMDDALNNTSLILLIDVGGTLLLFPGDAQFENWDYVLNHAPEKDAIRARLADATLYKVGHHGSLNATPKSVWSQFSRLGPTPDARLKTMVSTLGGKHGKSSRGTEVPRKKLVDELKARSDLLNTRDWRATQAFWKDVCIEISPSDFPCPEVKPRRASTAVIAPDDDDDAPDDDASEDDPTL